jgi:hypothetical protein
MSKKLPISTAQAKSNNKWESKKCSTFRADFWLPIRAQMITLVMLNMVTNHRVKLT